MSDGQLGDVGLSLAKSGDVGFACLAHTFEKRALVAFENECDRSAGDAEKDFTALIPNGDWCRNGQGDCITERPASHRVSPTNGRQSFGHFLPSRYKVLILPNVRLSGITYVGSAA